MFAALLLVATLLAAAPAAFAINQHANVGVSTISPCPSFCGGQGGMSEFEFDGGANATSALVDFSGADGNAIGRVDLAGQLLLPIVGAQAFSNSNSRASATATGMLAYDYAGVGATIDLEFTFDGEASAADPLDAGARASVVVMRGNDFPLSTDYGTLVFEIIDLTDGLDLVDSEQLFISANTGPQMLTGSVSIPLAPGDRIAVWGQVQASGTRGGSADALNTLSFEFTSAGGPTVLEGLTPVFVPSPSSLALLCSLLAMTCGHRSGRS